MNKSAEEMFKELNYRINNKYDDCFLNYTKGREINITFDLEDRDFVKTCSLGVIAITMEELQAINKQIEELRWNKEEK